MPSLLPALLRRLLVVLAVLTTCLPALDLTGLASDQRPERLAAIGAIGASREPAAAAFLEAYRLGNAFRLGDRIVLVVDAADPATPLDPLSRAPVGAPVPRSQLVELEVSRPEIRAITGALTLLQLTNPDRAVRLPAVVKAGDVGGDTNRAALAQVLAGETDPVVAKAALESLALIELAIGSDAASRAAAATLLGDARSGRALGPLRTRAAEDPDPSVKTAATAAIADIERYQAGVRAAQTAFAGISAGSILIIMALGLAITFGLMGVINMAHGEMLMIGAYAALLVQWAFAYLPAPLQPYYFILGLGAGFLAAAAVGWLLELTIIRHLYGRPLETLLATWGISYLLVQSVRAAFGDNQAVVAPAWLTGGWEPVQDLVLPWNRLFIIAVTIGAIALVWWLLNRTRLGLVLRATVQSRRTAASLGVNTRRIDGLTFALGSGIAGAGGCALTLIGGLKPDMGQEFIIDSFLVVAAGGVGNLWGVVCAGLGLGILNKVLEPWTQAVFAKVIVLMGIILFLQARPQGLFPPKGRLSDG
jgi:urea transport system permease protein